MLINAPEKVSASMDIEHYSLAIFLRLSPLFIVRLRLHPFCLEIAPLSAPLPPFVASNLVDALVAQLCDDCICSIIDCLLGDCDFLYPTPWWVWYPLRGKGLDVFDGMIRCVEEKAANEKKTLVV